jgi:prevent-host-death family protein
MTEIGSFEAKTHLPQLLERVAKGEKILITKRGKPVAMLVPPIPETKPNPRQVIKKMLAYRDQVKRTRGQLTFREMIEEGRRF